MTITDLLVEGVSLNDLEPGIPLRHLDGAYGVLCLAFGGSLEVYVGPMSILYVPEHKVSEWLPDLSVYAGLAWARRLLAKRLGWSESDIGKGLMWIRDDESYSRTVWELKGDDRFYTFGYPPANPHHWARATTDPTYALAHALIETKS